MINLFIDTSRRSLSVALTDGNNIIVKKNIESYSKHSNYLMNTLNDMFKENNLKPSDIDNIIVLNGPGSFTGVRVGVTVAKTIAWTLSKKLYLLTTLQALKLHASNDVVISVFFDKNTSSYVGIYDEEDTIGYMNIDDEKLNIVNKNITIVSYDENEYVLNLENKLKASNNVSLKIIDDYDYVKLVNYALTKENVNVHLATPIYLKKIDAEKKL